MLTKKRGYKTSKQMIQQRKRKVRPTPFIDTTNWLGSSWAAFESTWSLSRSTTPSGGHCFSRASSFCTLLPNVNAFLASVLVSDLASCAVFCCSGAWSAMLRSFQGSFLTFFYPARPKYLARTIRRVRAGKTRRIQTNSLLTSPTKNVLWVVGGRRHCTHRVHWAVWY